MAAIKRQSCHSQLGDIPVSFPAIDFISGWVLSAWYFKHRCQDFPCKPQEQDWDLTFISFATGTFLQQVDISSRNVQSNKNWTINWESASKYFRYLFDFVSSTVLFARFLPFLRRCSLLLMSSRWSFTLNYEILENGKKIIVKNLVLNLKAILLKILTCHQ